MHSSLGLSIGAAEWKTSDFVVTLIKEQQVPVYLSAQASALQYAPPFAPLHAEMVLTLMTRFPVCSPASCPLNPPPKML